MDLLAIKLLSVVVPFYNEEGSLKELYLELKGVLKGMGVDYELIFVDDGSKDGSIDIIDKILDDDNHVKCIKFRNNKGKARALMCGFKAAKGEAVITMDADLQDDANEIPKLISKLDKGYECVSGWKKNRKDPLSKRIASKIFNFITGVITGVKLHDLNCGFKAYKKETLAYLNLYGQLHRYIPVFLYWAGFRVGEVQVNHRCRKYGKSKYGWSRYFSFFDFLTIILLNKFADKPLYLFGSIGMTLFFSGCAINVTLLIWKYSVGLILSESRGLLLLILGVFLIIVGLQIVLVGLLGEFMLRLFREARDKK